MNKHSKKSVSSLTNIKPLRPIFALVVLLLAAYFINYWQTRPLDCGNYRLDTTIYGARQDIRAEVASDDTTREKGLSGRRCIPDEVGMLFSFNQSGKYNFWMKDMRFPIDILYINAEHKVVTIHPNVPPSSYPKLFSSSQPAQYVLELGANQSKALSIRPGNQLNF